MREAEFFETALPDIVGNFLRQGCILLKNFADPVGLQELKEVIQSVYREIDTPHIYPRHLTERDLPQFVDRLFLPRHHDLVQLVFKGYKPRLYRASSRRVLPEASQSDDDRTWQAPLGPHLDAAIHNFQFTLQFWIPLQACGVETPSLGVVCTDFDDVLNFVGFTGDPAPHRPDGEWNYGCFNSLTRQLWETNADALDAFQSRFGDRIWTPSYNVGDAMMLSNWTYHFTHSPPVMRQGREDIEFRFVSQASLPDVLSAHGVASNTGGLIR